jgi:Leucine-rich repeat (LRR) protein
MKNKNNKSSRKYLYINFLLLSIFLVIGGSCKVGSSGTGAPSNLIQFNQLTKGNPDIWQRYFEQWGAKSILGELIRPVVLGARRGQESRASTGEYVTINLMLLEDNVSPGLQQAHQANEVVKGILRYLIVENKQVMVLNIIGSQIDVNKRISSLPDYIGLFPSLLTLDLSFNKLTTLPSSLGRLTHLTNLDLNYNQLISIPIEIGNLARLQSLDLSNNQLTSIPIEIGNLAQLQSLNLRNNQLGNLPQEINNIQSLKSLDISKNRLQPLPIQQLNHFRTHLETFRY